MDGSQERQGKRKKNIMINLRIEEELRDQFYAACEEQCATPSLVLRRAILEYIEKHKSSCDTQ